MTSVREARPPKWIGPEYNQAQQYRDELTALAPEAVWAHWQAVKRYARLRRTEIVSKFVDDERYSM